MAAMQVIFSSLSEKRAIPVTNKILDSFAERIGKGTWRTLITAEGLAMVRSLLRKRATKSMAVACHYIRSRSSRSELLWIVGNKNRFNHEGVVPVHTTSKVIRAIRADYSWQYLSLIKYLTLMAAIIHDWGKANEAFQKMLKNSAKNSDHFRHEWITCKIIQAIVGESYDDTAWLERLRDWNFEEKSLATKVAENIDEKLKELPPIAAIICWLVLTHHRMPCMRASLDCDNEPARSICKVLNFVDVEWGYRKDDSKVKVTFKDILLSKEQDWQTAVSACANNLLAQKSNIQELYETPSLRPVLLFSRLSLMLGDYYFSSQPTATNKVKKDYLYANTFRDDEGKLQLKQKLGEHMLGVFDRANKIVKALPELLGYMEYATYIQSLRNLSSKQFAWQDKAVNKITKTRLEQQERGGDVSQWFVVNMASTGCGKTLANAKIMQALSPDGESLRYSLALGLRSLTMQTGAEYRDRIGLTEDDLAVMIGSNIIRELHEEAHKERSDNQNAADNDYDEDLLPSMVAYTGSNFAKELEIFLPNKDRATEKQKAFLTKPVLVATIDHLMPAVETVRGGRYMLPFLRMLSADLVIDEVDDFSTTDLAGISRLIHLAGMLGRNVVISSATIPPDLAEALYSAYYTGVKEYRNFSGANKPMACLWVDEFRTLTAISDDQLANVCTKYREAHRIFIDKRLRNLSKIPAKRRGEIIRCTGTGDGTQNFTLPEYMVRIKDSIISLHQTHGRIDNDTGKRFSIGLVRTANIDFCVAVSKFLLKADWGIFQPHIMTYHSRQTLLLRHVQEVYLDSVLKRKGEPLDKVTLTDARMRRLLQESPQQDVIFLVVATPVEEVGRDHDFDWAVVEPSSYRSIIQLAGRVLRHRELKENLVAPNIHLLEYNYRGLAHKKRPAFCRPGYESEENSLDTHSLSELIKQVMLDKIDAAPRISRSDTLDAKKNLADLEHKVMEDFRDLDKNGPAKLNGWLGNYWWLTGLPQKYNPFRKSNRDIKLCLRYSDDDELVFCEQDERGNYMERECVHNIKQIELSELELSRQWLKRDYIEELKKRYDREYGDGEYRTAAMQRLSEKYGEIALIIYGAGLSTRELFYNDVFGLYNEIT